MKRTFDVCFSLCGLLLLAPLLLGIALWIKLDSPGPALFRQQRVGRGGAPFFIFKFRTMVVDAEKVGMPLTVGHDPRITRIGRFLRRSKLDELPQLLNVLRGEMSLVGPRPEVPRYVQAYTEEQRQVLSVRPGITDLASIKYRDENDLLAEAEDPEQTYLQRIVPDKLRLNLEYIRTASLRKDIEIILATLLKIVFPRYDSTRPGQVWFTRSQRLLLLGLLDVVIIASAVLIAYLLRFDLSIPPDDQEWLLLVIGLQVGCTMTAFYWKRLYHRVLQYASIGELVSIIQAVTIAEVACLALGYGVQAVAVDFSVPRSTYVMCWALIILGIGGSRFAWRTVRDSFLQPFSGKPRRNALIIGAGGAGVIVAKNLLHSSKSDLIPVAFVDDNPVKHRLQIMGLHVVGGRDRIADTVREYDVKDIVIAIPSAPKAEIASIIRLCKETEAQIKIVPSFTDLIDGRFSVEMIRNVNVEDLLGREPVQVELQSIASYVTAQVVLVTGAGGSIGSELCRQLVRFAPRKLLLLGHGENSIYEIEMELKKEHGGLLCPIIADIQDRRRLQEVFAEHRPAVVFHAAAHKHVPLMERNPVEAVKNNILGTRNVAECAHLYGAARFVMISTDKAVNPTSVMGASKRVAEMIVQSLDRVSETKFVAVRFGNVLGSRGSVVPIFKKQIAQGGPVTVTHPEMIRFFMTIPEAVQLVIQAGALANGGEVFILDMGAPVKIADLARDLIRLSGFVPDQEIEIHYTGIRPGEKLYEEVLTNEEGLTATRHNRILVGKPLDLAWEELQNRVFRLEHLLYQAKDERLDEEIRDELRRLVPTYAGGEQLLTAVAGKVGGGE